MKTADSHPYFPYPAMKALKEEAATMEAARRESLKHSIALNTPDPTAAAIFVDLDGDDWAHLYPPTALPAPVSTDNAIDTFLDTYGHSSPAEDALLERLIFNPTPDYSRVLEQEAAGDIPVDTDDAQDALLAAFIEKDTTTATHPEPAAPKPRPEPQPHPSPRHTAEQPAKATEQGASLSESLARIFIRQGRYERAFEIISDLNLKNPEKSVYFADQLRFLQKLIDLQRARAGREKPS